MDVFITNKILKLTGGCRYTQISGQLYIIVRHEHCKGHAPKFLSKQFVYTYMDFIKVLTEPYAI